MVPHRAKWLGAVAGIITWLVLATLILGVAGEPTQSHGRFFLDNHGNLTPISHPEYIASRLRLQRIFSLLAALSFGAAVLVNLVELRAPDVFKAQLDQPG